MYFIIPDLIPALKNVLAITPAFAGISLGRNPNGAVNETVRSVREKLALRQGRRDGRTRAAARAARLDGFAPATSSCSTTRPAWRPSRLYTMVRHISAAPDGRLEAAGAAAGG